MSFIPSLIKMKFCSFKYYIFSKLVDSEKKAIKYMAECVDNGVFTFNYSFESDIET